MSRLHTFYIPLGAVTLVLATGDLSMPTQSSPIPGSTGFIAMPFPINEKLEKLKNDPSQVIDLAIEAVHPTTVPWQKVTIMQRARTDDIAFEAHSTLLRGPRHCARLETTLKAGTSPCRVLVVSDGAVLCQNTRVAGRDPQPVSTALPPLDERDSASLDKRERLLVAKGCGGPHAILADLKTRLKELSLATGMSGGAAAICISGQLDCDPSSLSQGKPLARPARTCRLYLDAQTLVPMRIEWWGTGGLVLEIAFSDVVLNQPLSHEECVREFTFTP